MAWGIDDGGVVFARLKLPQGHVSGDAMLSFCLQLVQHPGTFEGALACWEAWGAGCMEGGQAYHRSFSSTLDLQCAPCFLPLPRPSRRAPPDSPLRFDTLPLLLRLTLLSGSLVYALTLVDEMPGSGGLIRVHTADDDYIDKGFLLAHGGVSTRVSAGKASVGN